MKPEINDFVTNSYDEWWDSSRGKSWVPVQNHWVLVPKTTSPKLKMLGPLCNQTVNLKKDCKALYYSILKFKYSPSISKHNKCSMKYASLNNSHNNCHSNYTNRTYLQKHMFWLIDRSLPPTGRMPWINFRLWGFLCARDAGRRGNKITSGRCVRFREMFSKPEKTADSLRRHQRSSVKLTDVWGTSTLSSYWWRFTTQIWVVTSARAFFFPLPCLPTAQRGLCGGERQ